MRRFKDLLKNKFTWGEKDIESQPKPTDKPAQKSMKFVWGPHDLEHHGKEIKEEVLTEKSQPVPLHVKGNAGNPHDIPHNIYHTKHPFSGNREPEHYGVSHQAFAEHHRNLSDDEHYSGQHYKRSGYDEINGYLRGLHKDYNKKKSVHLKHIVGLKYKKDPHEDPINTKLSYHKHMGKYAPHPNRAFDAHLDRHVENLDNITNHRTVEDHKVFRGGIPGDPEKFHIGHEFTDHGYVSTSFSHDTAHYFAQSGGNKRKKVIHVIHVPKGSRAHFFDVGARVAHEGEPEHWGNSHESELVLQRGTRFKVTHHSEDANSHYIHSRVVKQGIRHKFTMEKKQAGPPVSGKQGKFPFMKKSQD